MNKINMKKTALLILAISAAGSVFSPNASASGSCYVQKASYCEEWVGSTCVSMCHCDINLGCGQDGDTFSCGCGAVNSNSNFSGGGSGGGGFIPPGPKETVPCYEDPSQDKCQ